jgi:hypothetical protein
MSFRLRSVILAVGLTAVVACEGPNIRSQADKPVMGRSPQAEAPKEEPKPKKPPRPIVRIIAHPQNAMVLYITDMSSSEERTFFGLPKPPSEAPVNKLMTMNLATGEWREINIVGEIEKRLALPERPVLTFDVGSVSRRLIGNAHHLALAALVGGR